MGAGDKEIRWVERSVRGTDGELEDMQVQQPSDGNVPGLIGERSYRCTLCGFAFKEYNIVMFRGKPYCIPNGCSRDISSILLKENVELLRSKSPGPENVSHFSEG